MLKIKFVYQVWLRQIQSLLGRGMGDAANKALEQGLKSLPRRKHIKVISRAAILEFRIGSPERARILFEGILRNYPKRTDLWSVYVDQVFLLVLLFVGLNHASTTLINLSTKSSQALLHQNLDKKGRMCVFVC